MEPKYEISFIHILFFSEVLTTPKDGEILIDYSKNRINDDVFDLLIKLVMRKEITIYRTKFSKFNISNNKRFGPIFSHPDILRWLNYAKLGACHFIPWMR